MPQMTQTYPLKGGLNLTTTVLELPPGFCIAALNYEAEVRGYRRIEGYERYDGHTRPSRAPYWVANFVSGAIDMPLGTLVTGAVSGATGRVIVSATVSDGAFVSGNAIGQVVLGNVSGEFEDTEGLIVDGGTGAVLIGGALANGEIDAVLDASYRQAAIALARSQIEAPIGSGPIRGVHRFNGQDYCFRDNAGGTAGQMFKATASGWALQAFGHTLGFAEAVVGFEEGATVTGRTSGASATVKRYIERSGTTGLQDAAGYMVLSGITGTFQADEPIIGGAGEVAATAAGAPAAMSILTFTGGSEEITAGTYLKGMTSNALAHVVDVRVTDGTWAEGNAKGFIECASASGTFQAGEAVKSFAKATATAAPVAAKMLYFNQCSAAFVPTQTLTGGTSGATGTIAYYVLLGGNVGSGTGYGYLILTGGSGVFRDTETITGTAGSAKVDGSAADVTVIAYDAGQGEPKVDFTMRGLSSGATGRLIRNHVASGAVAGTRVGHVVFSPVTGTFLANETLWQDDGEVKASGAVLSRTKIAFDAGELTPAIDGVLKGGTSNALATVQFVAVTTGEFGNGDAAGYLVLASVTGTFQDNESLKILPTAFATGAQAAIALPPGGRYSCANHNFYGNAQLQRMYFANGVGRAFEWDGTILTPIETGQDVDEPTRVAVFANHLFLAYRNGSAVHSAVLNPTSYQVIDGAGEIGFGSEITDMLDSANTALVIFGEEKIGVITGTDSETFRLDILGDDSGADAWTAQMIGNPTYLDNSGVRDMTTTQAFGNWRIGTKTQLIDTIIQRKRAAKIQAVGSIRVRAKDQYRLFYADGDVISIYIGRKNPECMPLTYPVVFSCFASVMDADKTETLLAGGADGMVYVLDSGTSFDGAAIPAFVRLAFNNIGSPTQIKNFKKARLEIDGSQATQLGITAEYSFADTDTPPAIEQQFEVAGGGGFWNSAFWNDFLWSAPVQGKADAYLDGLGNNISLGIISETATEEPHTLSSVTLNFAYRGQIR